MKKYITSILLLVGFITSAFAQKAEIRGSLLDVSDNTPLVRADVLLYSGEQIVSGSTSDSTGYFEMQGIHPGNYVLKVIYVEQTLLSESVSLSSGESLLRHNLKVNSDVRDTMNIFIKDVRRPKSEIVVDIVIDDIEAQAPTLDIIDNVLVNVTDNNGVLEVGPARTGSTQNFSNSNIPSIGGQPNTFLGLSGVQVLDRGVPARYGDFTGGGLQFTVSPIGVKPVNRFQFQSTSPFNGYHHNLGVMYISRALKVRHHEQKGVVIPSTIFGYSLMGSYKFEADPSPSAVNPFVITPEALEDIRENPLVSSEVIGGYVPATSFLNDDDLDTRQARPNAHRNDVEGRLKLSFNPTERISIDAINTVNYLRRRLSQPNFVLMNSGENPLQKYSYFNSQIQLSHNVKSPYDNYGNLVDSSQGMLSRLSYMIDINYQQTNSEISNARHGDRFFDYGYVGSFETQQVAQYNYVEDGETEFIDENGEERTLNSYYELSGYRDSLVNFTPGELNPELSEYTSFFFDKMRGENSIQDLVSRGGLLNGQNMPLLYSLYANPGAVFGSYSKSFRQRFSVNAYTEFSLHPVKSNRKLRHDFEVGLSFIQDASGYYNLNASQLWQLMPLLANSHIQNVDRNNPIIHTDEYGRFTDTVTYPVYVDLENQKTFDKNLREKLIQMGYRDENGELVSASTRINVNALSPDMLELNMFSADELLNNGNPYVAYSGYNHLGQRTQGKQGIHEFINNKAERPVDAFTPITAAAWIQDKFVLKSMIVRAGLRFEGYDANQQVLKDPFSLYPTRQAGEVEEINGQEVSHPSNIGDDYVVYVDNSNAPNAIVGYRDGSNWYDADGIELSDPSILANKSSSGRIQPYLLDPENQRLTKYSFKSFEAQNLVLPRISISFPINSTSLFYLSYDKLAQKPTIGQTYVPYTTYYYMQSNISGVLPNPELKARVKTEYNIGFNQNIGNFGTVKLWASYASLVNDFNQFRMVQAYPYSYTTYSNVDFSTIKRYVAEYEHSGPRVSFTASYAMQFADGTGSNANSAATLIQSGQPNLRSLFPLSYDNRHTIKGSAVYRFGSLRKDPTGRTPLYKGPYIGKTAIFENMFVSANFQSISGQPYTSLQRAISAAQAANGVVQRSQTKGNPFGSRMPWTHNIDMRVQKSFQLREKSVGVYVMVNNLLNNLLVQNVYGYTGEASDDGYLNSPHGQQQAQSQIDAQTFAMLYKIRMDNPGNFGAPRMFHLGANLNF